MKRVTGFVVVAGTALLVLVFLVAWYLFSYQPAGGSLGGMMGQMMGSGGPNGLTRAMPGWVWGAVVALLVLTALGLAGLGYYMAYPEIGPGPTPQPAAPGAEPEGNPRIGWDVLMRTSKPEERKVLEALSAHGGSYLQKFVVKEAGLSRLQTHRIVSRLAERGVVNVERSGNTNLVSLATWIRGEAVKPAPDA